MIPSLQKAVLFALLAISLGSTIAVLADNGPAVGRMTYPHGMVSIDGESFSTYADVSAGSTVETGPDGSATLVLTDGTIVRIARSSSVTLETTDAGSPIITLKQGIIWVRAMRPENGSDVVTVKTPVIKATASEAGALFIYRADKNIMGTIVLDSSAPDPKKSGVSLINAEGRVRQVKVGQIGAILSSGKPVTVDIPRVKLLSFGFIRDDLRDDLFALNTLSHTTQDLTRSVQIDRVALAVIPTVDEASVFFADSRLVTAYRQEPSRDIDTIRAYIVRDDLVRAIQSSQVVPSSALVRTAIAAPLQDSMSVDQSLGLLVDAVYTRVQTLKPTFTVPDRDADLMIHARSALSKNTKNPYIQVIDSQTDKPISENSSVPSYDTSMALTPSDSASIANSDGSKGRCIAKTRMQIGSFAWSTPDIADGATSDDLTSMPQFLKNGRQTMVADFSCAKGTLTLMNPRVNPAYCDDSFAWNGSACTPIKVWGASCTSQSGATFGGFSWDIPALYSDQSTHQIFSSPRTVASGSGSFQKAYGEFVCVGGQIFMYSIVQKPWVCAKGYKWDGLACVVRPPVQDMTGSGAAVDSSWVIDTPVAMGPSCPAVQAYDTHDGWTWTLSGAVDGTSTDVLMEEHSVSHGTASMGRSFSCDAGTWVPGQIVSNSVECDASYLLLSGVCRLAFFTSACTTLPSHEFYFNGSKDYTITVRWDGAQWTPSDVARTPAYSTSPTADTCQFRCEDEYAWDGTSCVQITSQTTTCPSMGRPDHSIVLGASTYTQTLASGVWAPIYSWSTNTNQTACVYQCVSGYRIDPLTHTCVQ